MKSNKGLVIGGLAALLGAGWLWSRKGAAAQDKGTSENPYNYADGWQGSGYYYNIPGLENSAFVTVIGSEEEYFSYQGTEPPPVTGTIFQNLQVIYPAVIVKGQDFIITVMFNYRGEGGVFNIGAILPVGPSEVSSQSQTLPPSADGAGWGVDLWFSGGPLTSLEPGTLIDIFSFISKPGILFSPSAAAQMEATRWYTNAIQINDVVAGRHVG